MEVHLVDGTYELFRHYFAVPSSKDARGCDVGAVKGVVSSLKGLAHGGATHIGVATDHVVESFRNQLWSGYKTGKGIEPDLLAQFPLLEEALREIGIAVWPMTEYEAAWLIERGTAAGRVHVIPGGPLVEETAVAGAFREKHGLGDVPVVLFLGQKLPYKGYRQLTEAAQFVWQQTPEARFVFAGPRTAESEAFFAAVTDPRIIDLPTIDAADKNAALADCTIFCLPSVEESLGLVYLEAWRFRKPVIAADIPIAREVVADRQDGLLVAQTAAAIAAAIVGLLRDPAACARLGAAGYHKVQQTYNWEKAVAQMENVYMGLKRESE